MVRVTWDVKQAAWLAEAGDEVFVLMKVGADVAREMMARRDVNILVLDMFVSCDGMKRIVIYFVGMKKIVGQIVMNGMCEFGSALLDDGSQTS